MPTPEFRCEIEPDRERAIVRPVGELDLATAPLIERSLQDLRARGFRHLVMDLRRITFIDSTGLRLLIAEARGAELDGYSLGIVAECEPVRRLLELTGARDRLPLLPADAADCA